MQATSMGQKIVNVFHFEATSALELVMPDDATAQNAGATLATAWLTAVGPSWALAHGADYTGLVIRSQVLQRPAQYEHRLAAMEIAATGANAFGGSAAADDPMTACVLKWQTPIAGKGFRGRTYLGPVPDVYSVNGLLAGNGIVNAASIITAVLGRFRVTNATPPVDWNFTIYSRPYNFQEYGYATGHNPNRVWKYPPDYAGNSTNVTAGTTDPVIRVQRRREIGVGA